jgi:hypothetical protein
MRLQRIARATWCSSSQRVPAPHPRSRLTRARRCPSRGAAHGTATELGVLVECDARLEHHEDAIEPAEWVLSAVRSGSAPGCPPSRRLRWIGGRTLSNSHRSDRQRCCSRTRRDANSANARRRRSDHDPRALVVSARVLVPVLAAGLVFARQPRGLVTGRSSRRLRLRVRLVPCSSLLSSSSASDSSHSRLASGARMDHRGSAVESAAGPQERPHTRAHGKKTPDRDRSSGKKIETA